MAKLELKVKKVDRDGNHIVADVALFARGEAVMIPGPEGVDLITYPRELLYRTTITDSTGRELRAIIIEKIRDFYDNLAPNQKSKVTGIVPEQL